MSPARIAPALLLACSLWLAACGPGLPQTPEGRWKARCARCHDLDGSSGPATERAGRPVDLRTAEFQAEYTDLRIRYIMQYGEGKMQGISGIGEAEMDSILVYVRGLTPDGPRALDSLRTTP